jgi:hypothetical protein
MPDRIEKDGKKLEGHWIDEGRLALMKTPKKELVEAMGRSRLTTPGGPQAKEPDRR